jgi:AraC-like DNA-binding protein
VDAKQFYLQLSMHLNESPRLMLLRLRLSKVAKMLLDTDKTKEELADELGFTSTNYMIASFFHIYRQTPDNYRNSNAL